MPTEIIDANKIVTEPIVNTSVTEVSAEKGISEPSAVTIKTDAEIPYNERLNSPEWQDFLERQIEKRVEQRLASQAHATKNTEEDELKELMEDFNIDLKTAKQLRKSIDKRVQKSVEPLLEGINKKVLNQSWDMKVEALAKKYPESSSLEKEMILVINSIDDSERNFILNSPKGLEHLLAETKKKYGNGSSNGINHVTTTSVNRSVPASVKLGETSELNKQAGDALRNGNRVEYERINKLLLRK